VSAAASCQAERAGKRPRAASKLEGPEADSLV